MSMKRPCEDAFTVCMLAGLLLTPCCPDGVPAVALCGKMTHYISISNKHDKLSRLAQQWFGRHNDHYTPLTSVHRKG